MDRDAIDRRAIGSALDLHGKLHGGSRAAEAGPPLRRRGEAVPAVRSRAGAPARAAGGAIPADDRGIQATGRGVHPGEQSRRGECAGDTQSSGPDVATADYLVTPT